MRAGDRYLWARSRGSKGRWARMVVVLVGVVLTLCDCKIRQELSTVARLSYDGVGGSEVALRSESKNVRSENDLCNRGGLDLLMLSLGFLCPSAESRQAAAALLVSPTW